MTWVSLGGEGDKMWVMALIDGQAGATRKEEERHHEGPEVDFPAMSERV